MVELWGNCSEFPTHYAHPGVGKAWRLFRCVRPTIYYIECEKRSLVSIETRVTPLSNLNRDNKDVDLNVLPSTTRHFAAPLASGADFRRAARSAAMDSQLVQGLRRHLPDRVAAGPGHGGRGAGAGAAGVGGPLSALSTKEPGLLGAPHPHGQRPGHERRRVLARTTKTGAASVSPAAPRWTWRHGCRV